MMRFFHYFFHLSETLVTTELVHKQGTVLSVQYRLCNVRLLHLHMLSSNSVTTACGMLVGSLMWIISDMASSPEMTDIMYTASGQDKAEDDWRG